MSKKKKVSSVKTKTTSKNKKITKTAPKVKKAVKKAPAKKPVVKKAVKKVAVKKTKATPKKIAPKAKKAVKPSKPAAKKAVAKKITKPAAKTTKPIAKKVTVKPSKPVKVAAKKEVKTPAKPEIKKPDSPKVLDKKAIATKTEVAVSSSKATSKKELEEDKKNEVLAIMNTIPKTVVPTLSASKIASITSSITNPVKKQGAYAVKVEKEPNGKFEIEFGFRASPEMLYEFFSTASGLSEWFCDDVNIRNGIYTFIWDGQMQQARLLKTIDNQLAKYQWVDKTDGSYFEFRIQRDDLTNDISLIVTDFADSKADQESAKLLWHSQIEKLMHVIGSIF